jgi:hypothetical protein
VAARTTQEPEEPQPENEVTTPESLGFRRPEIEVEQVQVRPQVADSDGTVQIRMSRTIEEFTFGNPHVHYHLEEGKIYKMPAGIAHYLDTLGAVYH